MNLLHITKTPRSEYDHLMLNLHDAMKADLDYQKTIAAAGECRFRRAACGCVSPTRPRTP